MADKPFVPIPVEVNTNKDTFVPIPFDPKTDRNSTGSILYEIADNIIGFDDGYDTMVERVTKPIGEAGEGLISGGIGILEGIGGLVSLVPDLVVGSDIGGAIDRGGDKLRESLDINPEGIAGKGTEFVTQYLAPGLGAVNIASKVGKAAKAIPKTKSQKLGQFVKDGAIFAGVETIVADDQASTVIGDWLGFDPAKTTDLIGLEGREAAMYRLLNKAKIFKIEEGLNAKTSNPGKLPPFKKRVIARLKRATAVGVKNMPTITPKLAAKITILKETVNPSIEPCLPSKIAKSTNSPKKGA